jgi:two-component system sensor histidine kinase BarA
LGGVQLKLLVAEDNKMSAKILDMLIKKAGHQCTVASDGQQAFDAYSATAFDIIFMDCRMPIIDGWEATKLIREKERKEAQEKGLSPENTDANHVPIVALTADDSREMCLQVGMDDYLSKPVDKAAFYEMLQRYAQKKLQRSRSSLLDQRRASRSDSLTQLPDVDKNKQIRIMLVEDNATNALIGARVLRRKNFQVDIAQNGKIALDMFRSNPDLYKLILMDIHMPVMDGVTCTRHIREYENAQNIENKVPIIALTADTTPRQRRICIEAGCNEYLSKPINYPLLVDTVKRFLQNLL